MKDMETRISGLTKLFEQSIGIKEPWYIRSIETKDAEVHVYVDIREGNFCRVRNAERCAKERGMRKQNGCGDMEIVCFIHVMYIVDDHG